MNDPSNCEHNFSEWCNASRDAALKLASSQYRWCTKCQTVEEKLDESSAITAMQSALAAAQTRIEELEQQLASEKERHDSFVSAVDASTTRLDFQTSIIQEQSSDLIASRDKWKERALAAESRLSALTTENERLREHLTKVRIDEQSLGGMRIEWRDDDGRHYAYDSDGKVLWSGDPTFNVWRLVRLHSENERLKEVQNEQQEELNAFIAKMQIATKLYARALGVGVDEATDNIRDAYLNRLPPPPADGGAR